MEKEKVEKIEKLQEKLDRLEIENEDLQKRLRVEQDKKDDVVELLQCQIRGLWTEFEKKFRCKNFGTGAENFSLKEG